MILALFASIGVAIANAVAAIIQKKAAMRGSRLSGVQPKVFASFFTDYAYASGIGLDILAGILTLYAVHSLPLFLTQSIIASGVVLTVILEQIVSNKTTQMREYVAIVLTVLGLTAVAFSTGHAGIGHAPHEFRFILIAALLVVPVAGCLTLNTRAKWGGSLQALLAGTSFGFVAIIGHVLRYPHHLIALFHLTLPYELVLFAIYGIFFFTSAVQRSSAGRVTSLLVSAETLIPVLFGLLLLHDHPAARRGSIALLGCLLVAGSCAYLASLEPA